jgi:hypothetical protein
MFVGHDDGEAQRRSLAGAFSGSNRSSASASISLIAPQRACRLYVLHVPRHDAADRLTALVDEAERAANSAKPGELTATHRAKFRSRKRFAASCDAQLAAQQHSRKPGDRVAGLPQ